MFRTFPVIHEDYTIIHNYFFERYSSILAFFLSGSSSTHSNLSFNSLTTTSITRFTFLHKSFSSSDPSFKADSENRILRGSLLVLDIPSEAKRIKYHSEAVVTIP